MRLAALTMGIMKRRGGGSFGAHAYWRVTIDTPGTESYSGWTAWRFYDVADTLIPTTGGTSSEGGPGAQGGHGHAALFDSDGGTVFLRSLATDYGQYQFASPVAPVRFEFDAYGATYGPWNFTIEYSDDGSAWTVAEEIWDRSWNASSLTRSYPQDTTGGKYRAVRLYVTANNGDRFVTLTEMEVRETISGADVTLNGGAFQNSTAGGYTPAFGFDSNTGTYTGLDTNFAALPGYFAYAFGTPKLPAEYTVRVHDDNGRGPNTFKLQGSNDGTIWTDLNSQASITWSVPETKTYAV